MRGRMGDGEIGDSNLCSPWLKKKGRVYLRSFIFMTRKQIFFLLIFTVLSTVVSAQVKVRIYANQSPESAIFTVIEGIYEIKFSDGQIIMITKDEPVIIMKFNRKLAVKKRNAEGFLCDSLVITGKTGSDSFSMRINGSSYAKRIYSGDLQCYPDMGTLVLINICDIEKYISGVVMAEGGAGRNLEYFKTQAIIARTYMYKYFDKHKPDKYNVCDNTHCQAFNGLSSDTLLNEAALETKGIVILGKDSSLIISAFSSNCGGETASSEDVWFLKEPYLKSVADPYCHFSKNAAWQKSFSVKEWLEYLRKSGYTKEADDLSVFNFLQKSRQPDYEAGSLRIPLRTMRSDLDLRSTFFSVYASGDSIILKGRGYGHGVGLCQEGAMVMASKGFTYREIINFYYTGVFLSDIKNAVALP
jgi:stage II sporulation protein D